MGDELKPCFSGEMMLAGWRDTNSSGATVTFWLPESADLDVFRGMTVKKGGVAGQRMAAVLVEIGDDESKSTEEALPAAPSIPQPPNTLASELHKKRYWHNPVLWSAMEHAGIYKQAQHKAWIESQPCWYPENVERPDNPMHAICNGDVMLHLCKSAADPAAGRMTKNPQKPPHWFGLPLCHTHHTIYAHSSVGADRNGKEAMRLAAIQLTADQMKRAMKAHLGIESMRQITQGMLIHFEAEISL